MMRTLSAVTVVCSCGKECRVIYSTALGKFIARKQGWTFGDNGWTCGEQGHYQEDVKDELCENPSRLGRNVWS